MQNLAVHALITGAEGAVEGASSSGGLDNVLNNVTKVVEFSGNMLNAMLSNPIYAFLFAVSFIGIGVGIVSLFRSAARG